MQISADDYLHGRGPLTFVQDDGSDGDEGAAAQDALAKRRLVVRPKYVRGPVGGANGGTELGFWVRVGVAISRTMSGEGMACAVCRFVKGRSRSKVRVILQSVCFV